MKSFHVFAIVAMQIVMAVRVQALWNEDEDDKLLEIVRGLMGKSEEHTENENENSNIVKDDCRMEMLGLDYKGTINVTRSGRSCQAWASQEPHTHDMQDVDADVLKDNNYCRNPDKSPDGPWCYTTDENQRWEYCEIPYCGGMVDNTYVGCFKDSKQRHFENRQDFFHGITLTDCREHCNGYKYFGLQFGYECFCGNSLYKDGHPLVADSACNVPCIGEPTIMCGGRWRNSIYRV